MIKIDTREKELFHKCEHVIRTIPKFAGLKLSYEPLPLGDIIIGNVDGDGETDCVIVERKTLSDLAASIQDGRYAEQSYRLNGLPHHNHNIMYLIEGDINRFNAFKDRINKQTLYSAMFSINYFKGFSVMRSFSMDETALMICNMVTKLVSDMKLGKTGFYTNKSVAIAPEPVEKMVEEEEDKEEEETKKMPTEKDYCTVVKKVKKENITSNNIGEIMLCQIPGVSSSSALAILSKFTTLPNLIKCIQEDATCLNTVCTVDANGKSRKISKTTIATIVQFLSV